MSKKLAITVAGAVSLGSYEAGVLYEVVTAIGAHNDHPATKAKPEESIEIDVLTGASAGGMTATIAAQKLLFEADSLTQPYNNSFYRPWVKDISLDGLLALQQGEDATHSILSSELVEDISRKHLTLRYTSHVAPVQKKHPAAAKKIYLGLALSNLNGVDYKRSISPTGDFRYTRYQDELTKLLDSDKSADDSLAVWEILRNAAVACGAFPFAFRTKDLARNESEYADEFLIPFASEVRAFTYTDGGTFQNEPLGLAKNLVDEIDPGHLDTENRFYLFVAPGARGGTSSSQFREKIANLSATGKELIAAIFQQARFHDWIMAENVNAQVRLFDERALELHRGFLAPPGTAGAIDSEKIEPAARQLLPPLFKNDGDAQGKAWHRLQQQFQKEYDELVNAHQGNSTAANSWIDCILAFETAASLGDRDEMVIYGITATEDELASSKFESFLGFFDQAYRDHDYDVGRKRARDVIKSINDSTRSPSTAGSLGPIRYDPPQDNSDIHPIDESLDGLELTAVPRDQRKRFKDRLTDRAHELMAELGVAFPLREAIDLGFITPKLNKLLSL